LCGQQHIIEGSVTAFDFYAQSLCGVGEGAFDTGEATDVDMLEEKRGCFFVFLIDDAKPWDVEAP
jgi:hypothetical protein